MLLIIDHCTTRIQVFQSMPLWASVAGDPALNHGYCSDANHMGRFTVNPETTYFLERFSLDGQGNSKHESGISR